MHITRSKAEILASDLPPIEKIWQIASQRSDIGKGSYGVVAESLDGTHIYGRWGTICCPTGAVLIGEEQERGYHHTAAALLGVSTAWVGSFVDGFDGVDKEFPDDPEGYAAGQEIRRRFEERGVCFE